MSRSGAEKRGFVITVDGPSAAGKGTLARRLSAHFGFEFLDTGSLYRGVGLSVLRQGLDPADENVATAAARGLKPAILADSALRSEATSAAASKVAAIPAVRAAILNWQRDFARNAASSSGGAVLDGRDIGTVIAPHATAKLFVTASAEVRARRRVAELLARGMPSHYDDVLIDIRARDARDSGREAAPLAQADDAELLDTSEMSIDEAIAAAIALVEERIKARA
jgi:cytidylate kinase